jgi:hypothetical protein
MSDYRDELGRIEDGDKEFVLLMQRVPGAGTTLALPGQTLHMESPSPTSESST